MIARNNVTTIMLKKLFFKFNRRERLFVSTKKLEEGEFLNFFKEIGEGGGG